MSRRPKPHARAPRGVLFDMDGVLLHSYEAWLRLVQAAGRDLAGREITREEFDATWGQGVAADVKRFFRASTEDEVTRYYLEHFEEHAEGLEVDPEARGVLEELGRRGIRTAVITNTPGALARKILSAAGLQPETVAGADEVPRAKPAPDLVLEACSRLGLDPGEVLVVGDSPYDREAAAAAGAPFVGVRGAGGEIIVTRLAAVLRLLPGGARLGSGRRVRRGLAIAASFAVVAAAAGWALRANRSPVR